MTTSQPSQSRRTLLRPVVVAIALVALVAALIATRQPPVVVHIPTPVMPVPNARSDFDDAAALMRDGNAVSWAITPPIPLPAGSPPSLAANLADGYHVFTLAEKDKLVAENRPVFDKIRQGLRHQYQAPIVRSFDTRIPYLAKDRSLARLLSLQGQTRGAHGDWDGALASYVDCIQFGAEMTRGGGTIDSLVGDAIQAMGRRSAWDAVHHVGTDAARRSALRIAAIDDAESPYWRSVQEHEWTTQASLEALFRKPNWRDKLGEATGASGSGGGPTPGLVAWFRMITTTPGMELGNYTRYMDRAVIEAKRPYQADRTAAIPLPSDPFMLVIGDFNSHFKWTANAALNSLLVAELALRAYQCDHGHYPGSLAELTPTYLPQVPDDPFALSGQLKYQIVGTHYLLYSVGPDGRDDRGKPIFDPTRIGPSRYVVLDTSRGDIVAGVNH